VEASSASEQPVLLIDDDEELGELLSRFLRKEGFAIEVVADGVNGLTRARDSQHSAVILDVMMPGMNGFDLLRELRKSSNVPVIMLTARGQDIDRIVGLEMGADDYLGKPFNPRELAARLRAIQRRLRVQAAGAPDARPLLHMAESVTTFTTAGGVSRYVERRPELPASGQEDPWFLPPLRTGALAPDGLHPLVQEALFPNRPAQPYRRPPGVPVPDRIAVACAGRRHHVGFRGGHLVLLSHGPDEFRREQVLTALTAQASGCFEVLRNWTAGTGWLPDHLWALAEHRVLAARGGDTAEVARLA